jgi:hypothetical protein
MIPRIGLPLDNGGGVGITGTDFFYNLAIRVITDVDL